MQGVNPPAVTLQGSKLPIVLWRNKDTQPLQAAPIPQDILDALQTSTATLQTSAMTAVNDLHGEQFEPNCLKCSFSTQWSSPPAKIAKEMSSSQPKNNKNNKNNKSNTAKKNTVSKSESDNESVIDMEKVVTQAAFQMEVRHSFATITELLKGDGKEVKGLVNHVETLEDKVNGTKEAPGLSTRIQALESKAIRVQPPLPFPPVPSSSSADLAELRAKITILEQSNAVLMGASSCLQRRNKSLQNEVYVQKDKQNFLNLHFGGVQTLAEKSTREEVVQFCHDILKLPHVKEDDIVKAYHKSEVRELEETAEDESGQQVVLQVSMPGVMFMRLHSECLREQSW